MFKKKAGGRALCVVGFYVVNTEIYIQKYVGIPTYIFVTKRSPMICSKVYRGFFWM
jgi:hypothetical protein